jgi:glycosyltransferase involved in cell wall biosynthesis
MLKISYLITCHNEDCTLKNLLQRVSRFCDLDDEIVILDDFSDNPKCQKILLEYSYKDNVRVYQHALDRNYGAHKNYGNELCKGDWIFQIDADELPSEVLLMNIKNIIGANPDIELFLLPRVNDFKGVKQEHANQWGWRLTPCKEYGGRPIINWPDYQGRVYKNVSARIRWDRRLHEKIEGYTKYSALPAEVDFSLYHDKTIETQLQTNLWYNKEFTEDENRGYGGYKQNV